MLDYFLVVSFILLYRIFQLAVVNIDFTFLVTKSHIHYILVILFRSSRDFLHTIATYDPPPFKNMTRVLFKVWTTFVER